MSSESVVSLVDELHALEAAPSVDHDAVDAVLAKLHAHGEDALIDALGLHEHQEDGPEAAVVEPHAEFARHHGARGSWRNWPRNRKTKHVEFEAPQDAAQLVENLRAVVRAGGQLKAIGAGFSCSEASQPPERAVALNTQAKLDRVLPIDHARAGVDTGKLVRAQAGIRLIDLAEYLHREREQALSNLGGFAKQTLAGVISTATHGTGLHHSSFSDMVVSVDIACVDEQGEVGIHRFEPDAGITDPQQYPEAATRLHQDSELFYAMVVGCGMLGVVYSYTIEIVDLYFVEETHERFVFPDDFAGVYARAHKFENVSITVHPYATLAGGKHLGFMTRFRRLSRSEVSPELWANPPTRPASNEFIGALAKVLGTKILGWFMAQFPRIVLEKVTKVIEGMPEQKFTSVYYKTFPRSTGDRFRASFSESSIALPELEAGLRRAFLHAERVKSQYYYLVPFALRFIKASKHLLSMHYGRDSGTIESFVVKGVPKSELALRELEQVLPGGRPHWGQMHWFLRPVDEHYPDSWARWHETYLRYNSRGTFNSPITELLKIST